MRKLLAWRRIVAIAKAGLAGFTISSAGAQKVPIENARFTDVPAGA
ncbi:hypothetical protein KCTCHS21_31010 [Cohnella abietis]|uniref:Uncharacterized protein n=1 Tax=Cohnella abietis TaxID=2507935 RepID=A0A3T1D6K0_9BACL|nr:hypothetical protein KCTCHS21_31010 [Cohnella abietis]